MVGLALLESNVRNKWFAGVKQCEGVQIVVFYSNVCVKLPVLAQNDVIYGE